MPNLVTCWLFVHRLSKIDMVFFSVVKPLVLDLDVGAVRTRYTPQQWSTGRDNAAFAMTCSMERRVRWGPQRVTFN